MTPAQIKAKELVDKFMDYTDCADEFGFAVKCALIAVDEIINHLNGYEPKEDTHEDAISLIISSLIFYQEVKQEINNLK